MALTDCPRPIEIQRKNLRKWQGLLWENGSNFFHPCSTHLLAKCHVLSQTVALEHLCSAKEPEGHVWLMTGITWHCLASNSPASLMVWCWLNIAANTTAACKPSLPVYSIFYSKCITFPNSRLNHRATPSSRQCWQLQGVRSCDFWNFEASVAWGCLDFQWCCLSRLQSASEHSEWFWNWNVWAKCNLLVWFTVRRHFSLSFGTVWQPATITTIFCDTKLQTLVAQRTRWHPSSISHRVHCLHSQIFHWSRVKKQLTRSHAGESKPFYIPKHMKVWPSLKPYDTIYVHEHQGLRMILITLELIVPCTESELRFTACLSVLEKVANCQHSASQL